MTNFTGLPVGTAFFGSALEIVLAVKGGVDGGTGIGLLGIEGTACLAGTAAGVAAGLSAGFAARGCAFEGEPPAAGVGTFGGAPTTGLELLDTTGFFTGTDTVLEGTFTDLEGTEAVFLAGNGATFLATGLAILLDTGAFLASLLPPDDWAGLVAAFLAGTIFFTLVGFLAGFAAFFLVAIQLGFFSDKHF
jgi:hypothetical protein